jgi:peptide/histidine transporter 3/4
MSSVFIEQAQAMDASLWGLTIPAAGMGVFEILGVTAFVFIYSFCIARIVSKVASREPTELERMGVGLVISTLAMITAGVVEQQRLKHATTTTTRQAAASLSSLTILWQIPQYVLIGASEVFMYVTMTEFFNDQLPEGLRSLGSAMSVASMSAGNFASSLLVTVVMAITCKGGQAAAGCWIPQDLNQGHVDRFFFVIAALNAMDLLAYVVFARRYRPAPLIKPAGADETS